MLNQEEYLKQHRKSTKKWRENHKERDLKITKDWREKNKERISISNKQWRKDNPEYFVEWEKNNPEYHNEWLKNKYKNDIRYNLKIKISSAIGATLKRNKNGKQWQDLVGYTVGDLIKRLKSTLPENYNWNDFLEGKLHIDHIIPIRAFIFDKPEDEEFKQCWSLYNLKLLSAKENNEKHDKINNLILLGLLLKRK